MIEASAVREKALLRFYSYMGIEFENSWSLRVPEVGSDQEAMGERARPKGEGQVLLLALPSERVKEGIGEGISSLDLKDFQVQ